MQAMPDSRTQSFEEIYGPPENFLEIEVSLFLWLVAPSSIEGEMGVLQAGAHPETIPTRLALLTAGYWYEP